MFQLDYKIDIKTYMTPFQDGFRTDTLASKWIFDELVKDIRDSDEEDED
jgi:hypothetical protein